jgi:hypothetical protein
LLQQIFNTSCRWWLAQEQAKGMMKFDEKKVEEIWENLREIEMKKFQIWNCDVLMFNSVRISTLYPMFMMLINPN